MGGRRGLHATTSGSRTRSSDRLAEAYRRIRNTCRFLLGNLADFDPATRPRRPYERWTSSTAGRCSGSGGLIARVRRAYEEYEFHLAFHAVHNFCAVDLSALYLDILKDRLYTSAAERARGGAPPRPRATRSSTRSPG